MYYWIEILYIFLHKVAILHILPTPPNSWDPKKLRLGTQDTAIQLVFLTVLNRVSDTVRIVSNTLFVYWVFCVWPDFQYITN